MTQVENKVSRMISKSFAELVGNIGLDIASIFSGEFIVELEPVKCVLNIVKGGVII